MADDGQLYCDVALPVFLNSTFTYRIPAAGLTSPPKVGARVLVPFRAQRLTGVITALHDHSPVADDKVQIKDVVTLLDPEPLLDATLFKLAEWIAGYYLAPLGEVFRSMLPLAAEVRRARQYRLAQAGAAALHASANAGSSRRSRKDVSEQMADYAVLDYLANSDAEAALESALRSATGASRKSLDGLVRKKWITREDVSSPRDARRMTRIAVLRTPPDAANAAPPGLKLNANQRSLLDSLAVHGGRLSVDELRAAAAGVPVSTLKTLVKRALIDIIEEPAGFALHSSSRAHAPLAFVFNPDQKHALQQIQAAVAAENFSVALLHGVTGSGKTAVYLAAMQGVLAMGKSALMLVPEIGLTPAAAANLHAVFGEQVAILHSALTAGERAEQWHRIHRGEARVVVGTRSAVFAPIKDLALLVVDEEHDSSYKQEETPRYNGRDVAVMRAKLAGAAVVLGSATPSLESYHNAEAGKYALLRLPQRVELRPLPAVTIVDMRQEIPQSGEERIFSDLLLSEITACIERREQAIVLLNRRGFSPVVLCRSCGQTVQCKNCAIAMTHHRATHKLECHYCGFRQPVPEVCPSCSSEHIHFLGVGSEKIEDRLHGLFPQARIGRLDRDTVHGRHDFERILNQLHAGDIDLLVGTQMIAKGHDIHGVTLVGVVGADFALGFPDFRAAERTFQLLTQVAGRAGRGDAAGKVILQAYFPEHYALQFAAQHDYAGFYEKELRYRSWMQYPPFTSVATVLLRSERLDEALKFAGMLGNWFEARKPEGIRLLGPAAAPIIRLKRDYRYHFVLKSKSRERLNATLRAMMDHAASVDIPRNQVIVDMDALSLL